MRHLCQNLSWQKCWIRQSLRQLIYFGANLKKNLFDHRLVVAQILLKSLNSLIYFLILRVICKLSMYFPGKLLLINCQLEQKKTLQLILIKLNQTINTLLLKVNHFQEWISTFTCLFKPRPYPTKIPVQLLVPFHLTNMYIFIAR